MIPLPTSRRVARSATPPRLLLLLFLLFTPLLFPISAHAQLQLNPGEPRPDLPPIEDEEAQPIPPGRVLKRIPIPADDPAADLFAGGTISVRGFRFVGNEAISDATLNEVVRSYVGEGRRYGALLEARDRVTRAYIDAGYISSGAVLADPPIQDGIVEIQIVEGRLTTIEVESDGRLRDRYLTSRLALAGQDKALNLGDLRRRLRILKRDPNIEVITSELAPGQERHESVLTVQVREPTPWFVGASFDDYVTPAIGGYRGRYSAGFRNLTGWGEEFSANYTMAYGAGSEDRIGLHDIDARLSVPVTRWDTSIEIRVRRAWSEIIEKPIDRFDIESRTQAYSLRVRQPLLRERTHQLGAFVAGEWKRGKSTLLGGLALSLDPQDDGESTVSVLRAGVDGWWRGERRAISGRLTLSIGLDILDAGSDGLDLDGEFYSGLLQIQAVEYLPWIGMRLLARLDGQLADDSILGLEQFAAGGHASVRGFRENLLVRDQGIVGSLELRIPMPGFWHIERFEIGIFGDAGSAGNHRGGTSDTIGSIGLGLHANITSYASASLQWAHSLQDPAGNLVGDHIQDDGVHFSLRIGFP